MTRPNKACLLLGLVLVAGVSSAHDWRRSDTQPHGRTITAGAQAIFVDEDHVRWVDGAGKPYLVSLPPFNRSFVYHYRPVRTEWEIAHLDSGIGPTQIEGSKVWFGLKFYEGEGSAGVGGVGFIDTQSGTLGLLRHPALLDCSISSLEVDASSILALTFSQGELASGPCNGLVTIDRKSLSSTLQRPPKHVSTIWDKDGGLSEEEEREVQRYAGDTDLAARFADRVREPGPAMALEPGGLVAQMRRQAELERDWFAAAVARGEMRYNQRCTLVAGTGEMNCQIPIDVDPASGGYAWANLRAGFDRWVARMSRSAKTECTPGWHYLGVPNVGNLRPAGRKPAFPGNGASPLLEENWWVISGPDNPPVGEVMLWYVPGEVAWKITLDRVSIGVARCTGRREQESGPTILAVTVSFQEVLPDDSYVPAPLRRRTGVTRVPRRSEWPAASGLN